MTLTATMNDSDLVDLGSEARTRLARVLYSLDPVERVLLGLRYIENLTTDEIAAVLDAPVDDVRLALHEALDNLRLAAA